MNLVDRLIRPAQTLALENAELKDRIEALEAAHEHILEYWNKDENPGAMSDALWHILDTASEALKEKDQ